MSALENIRSTFVLSTIRKTIQSFVVVLLFVFCTNLQAQSLTELEYFFGNDPGVGNGTLVTASTNTGDLTQSIAIPLTGLLSGFHKLTFRAKDDANVWSLYHRKTFYISEPISTNPIANLAAVEYWFDADPGHGNGTVIAISGASSETVENFVIPLGILEAGFHTLSIRVKDLDNTWSLYHRKTFYIIGDNINDAPSNLAAVEYWFGADPGNGNGTAIPISGAPSETVEDFAIPLGALEAGFHTLSIRIKNVDDRWSLYHRKTFYIISPETSDPPSPLTDAEFLYDAELGFGTGTAVAITPTGNPYEYLVEIPTDLVTCGLHDISLSVKNALGNYSLYDVTVDTDVYDNIPPTIVVFPNITVELDATGQAVPFTIADVDNGTFDDCELDTVVLNQAQFDYTCADLGANTVTITATDAENKVSTLDVTVTVVDTISPVAITQNITVQLDANGNASVTADAIDNNSIDNCSIANKSLDVSNFTCDNLGVNIVVLTVTDQSGNENTTTATVMVEDVISPVAISQNITLQLDAIGNASTTANSIDNNSTDNCSITNKNLDVSNFTCDDLGANTVVLTITDQSGNQNTTTAIVMVEDNINPMVITQNITVQLDANGNASVTADAVDNNSTDNCSVISSSLDKSNFTCTNLGMNTVVLTVVDQSGNQNTTNATVVVEDNIDPMVITQNITVQLDANGNASTTADAIDNNSTDNCSIANKSLNVSNFTCDDLGANTVVLTVTDQSGNQNATDATVTVEDNLNPMAIGQDITIDLAGDTSISIVASDVDNGSNDNCGSVALNIDIDTFTTIGVYPVVLTVMDDFGNTHNITVLVTVEDSLSIEEFNFDTFNVFPNPTKNTLYVNFEQHGDYSLSIYDVSGKEVFYQQQLELNNTFNFSKYASGIYILKIKEESSNRFQNIKIVKM